MNVVGRLALSAFFLSLLSGCASTGPAFTTTTASEAYSRADVGRVMIRSGSLDLRVKDVAAAKSRIEEITNEVSGRVDDWSARNDDWLSMTLRVPEAQLEHVMDRIAALGKVTGRSLRSRDVTEQLIDLEARVKNLRSLRDRLRAYLDKASSLEDILAVERELARVQTELESLEAKLKVLRDQIAMSELDVTVTKRGWF